jgi:hypothetical protein
MNTYPPFPIRPQYAFPHVRLDVALVNSQMHAAEAMDGERLDWTPSRIETCINARQEFIEEFGRDVWEREMEPLLLESLARRLGCVR